MNSVEFTTDFQKMEIEYGLFDLQTVDGIFFWDMIRHDIFYLIFRNKIESKKSNSYISEKHRYHILNRFFTLLRFLISDFIYLLKNINSDYLVIACSRNLINSKPKDIILDDYLKIIERSSFIIETNSINKTSDRFSNKLLNLMTKMNYIKASDLGFDLSELINNRYELNIDVTQFVIERIQKFRSERQYYLILLKLIRPKLVFIVQNGIQKGLFMACKELKIKTVELQHGYVNYTHPAYSYPKLLNVSNEKQINLPYTFITFSEYWSNNIYYPVKEIIPFGNSFYAKNCLQQVTNRKNLTFISADIFQKTIEFYVDSIVDYVSDGCALNIKLHPNQYNTKIDIIQKYEKYPNINVYSDDISINELLSTSKEVIVISSTIAYEALQSNCNLAIIQDDSSFDLIDLFDQPNVRIIHSPSELLLQKKNIKSSVKYFEEFQSDSFSEFLKCN